MLWSHVLKNNNNLFLIHHEETDIFFKNVLYILTYKLPLLIRYITHIYLNMRLGELSDNKNTT